jgi:DNA-binding NtrC family response regulator
MNSSVEFIKKFPFDNKSVYILHDSKGTIKQIINDFSSRFELIIKELAEAGSLARYYDFSKFQKKDAYSVLNQTRQYQHPPFFYRVHTRLPMSSLIIRKYSGNEYLGRISFFEYEPNILTPNVYGFVLTDMQKDTILGFHEYFYRLFRQVHSSPQEILDVPASNLVSPTPKEFQEQNIADFSLEEAGQFKKIYGKNYSREDLDILEDVPFKAGLSKKPEGGLLWECKEGSHRFITVLREVDTTRQDFIATLTYRNAEGQGPYFTLGDRYHGEDDLPDNQGYLMALAIGEGFAHLKRIGFTAAKCGEDATGKEEITLHFCKIGLCFYLYKGKQRVLEFFDNEFIHNERGNISLGLREGYACILKSFSISVRRTHPREFQKPQKLIIRLTNKQSNYYTLDRYYNYLLTQTRFSYIGGYLLYDITDLQGKIQKLDQQYKKQIKREEELKNLLRTYQTEEGEFIGTGSNTAVIKETAKTVAPSNATVLLEGPTGSGKEVLAKFIHRNSLRKDGPYIKVDCATVPRELIESHLFGHEKGAFTGAVSQNIGMFERANGGTLFLDEVANLTVETQTKLLQFYNDFTISRIGGTEPIRIDVRCIIASNENLEARVKAGTFREDLYYRINVVKLKLPPLKDRGEDIPELAGHFLHLFNTVNSKRIKSVSSEAMKKLMGHGWPGNIRELKNVIQRAVIFCGTDTITPDLIRFAEAVEAPPPQKARRRRSPFRMALTDREYITGLLEQHNGVVINVARELGISKVTLYKYLKDNKIDADEFRRGFGNN